MRRQQVHIGLVGSLGRSSDSTEVLYRTALRKVRRKAKASTSERDVIVLYDSVRLAGSLTAAGGLSSRERRASHPAHCHLPPAPVPAWRDPRGAGQVCFALFNTNQSHHELLIGMAASRGRAHRRLHGYALGRQQGGTGVRSVSPGRQAAGPFAPVDDVYFTLRRAAPPARLYETLPGVHRPRRPRATAASASGRP